MLSVVHVIFLSAASDARTNRKVAVKKIPGAWKDLSDGHRILREITILQHLNHPNVPTSTHTAFVTK